MNKDAGVPDNHIKEQISFFGRISASFSHEVNNMLAVINENSGIIKDITALSQDAAPELKSRLDTYCERILNHSRRGAALVKQFNRFSHSMDETETEIDVQAQLTALGALCGRFASMKKITIEEPLVKGRPGIKGAPILLLHSVFLCMESLLNIASEGGKIILSAEGSQGSAQIRICAEPVENDPGHSIISPLLQEVVDTLNGRTSLFYDNASKRLQLTLEFGIPE